MPRLSKLPDLDAVSVWLEELSQVLSAIAKTQRTENGSVTASLKEENNKLKAELCGLRHLAKKELPLPLSGEKSSSLKDSKEESQGSAHSQYSAPATDEETTLDPSDAVEHGPTLHGPRPFLVTKPSGVAHKAFESNTINSVNPALRLSFNDYAHEVYPSETRDLEDAFPGPDVLAGEVVGTEEPVYVRSKSNSRNLSEIPSSDHRLSLSDLDADIASAASRNSCSSASLAYSVASYTHAGENQNNEESSPKTSQASLLRRSRSSSKYVSAGSERSSGRTSAGENLEGIAMWPVWAANRQGRRAIYGATSGMRKIGVQIAGLSQGAKMSGKDKSMTSNFSEPWQQAFTLRPSSMRRFVWDVFGGFLISYDLFMVPLTQFEMPGSTYFDVVSWIITIFWTCDILRQFFIGYEDKGREELRLSRIARRYLSTWFIPDVVVVLIDWLCIVFSVNQGTSARSWHISKSIRALRILRTLRLVRVFKILLLFQRFKDRLQSEYVLLFTKAMYIIGGVIIVTHYTACYWFAVANLDLDGAAGGWLSVGEMEGFDMGHLYVICLHWALGQSGLSTVDIVATTALERLYSVGSMVIWLCAWIVAASYFSSSLMQVREAHRAQFEEEANIRKFLGMHSVSGDLTHAILTFCRNNETLLTKRLFEETIETFHNIPENLRMEMHMEVYFPVLRSHLVFAHFFRVNPLTTKYVCHLAMSEHHCDAGQELCQEGLHADLVFYINIGEFSYHPTADDGLAPNILRPGKWFCEVALWRKWVYNGSLLSRAPSTYTQIHAQTFHAIMEEADAQGWAIEPLRRYAKLATVYYHEADPYTDIWDNEEKLIEFADQAFKTWDGWAKMEQSWKAWAFQNPVHSASTARYGADSTEAQTYSLYIPKSPTNSRGLR